MLLPLYPELLLHGMTKGIGVLSGSIWPSKSPWTTALEALHAGKHVSVAWCFEEHTYIPDCFVKRSESGLLIIVVDAAVAMQNRHAFPLSLFAVASIHAVIGAVVPLAGEHVETLWWQQRKRERDTYSQCQLSPVRVALKTSYL